MTWVLNRVALGVGIVGFESDINAYLLASRNMLYLALCLDPELHIVAIGTVYHPHPFDLLGREGFNLLLGIAYQSQASNTTAIGERDVFPIGL